jgi:SAM-dependent methyltransferase
LAIEKIVLQEAATEQNFDENAYLAANPDVDAAVRGGNFKSGRHHFECFGHKEGRVQRWGQNARVTDLRRAKLARLEPFLRSDLKFRIVDGKYDFLTEELRHVSGLSHTENISSNIYDQHIFSLIEETQHGIILDCGAGRRDVYLSNVVNFEVVNYDTTDVMGVGETLPFNDSTFDGVISVAVLEHVKYPFRCASEICRVLKPGGWLFCSVPFLQPYHGYPHHYFL